ncbi:MAG: addiction module toxin RelE [Candidatus Paracaedibacteraceae bacterium]|nr:addiction module toxin RelE [Candidatus Paracaedibacteraceae bacterium]
MEFDLITIVETSIFIKEAERALADKELDELKLYLASSPESGDVIPGLRGIRKLRWQANKKEKRGGARVIYFFYSKNVPLFLLDIYTKSKKEDLSPSDKKELNWLVNELLKSYGV